MTQTMTQAFKNLAITGLLRGVLGGSSPVSRTIQKRLSAGQSFFESNRRETGLEWAGVNGSLVGCQSRLTERPSRP